MSELLEQDDWEAALLLLEESAEVSPQPSEFWDLLADAARLLWLHDDARWYGWRSVEARGGVVLAELRLGPRRSPVPSCGLLRPMWDVGRTTPDGDPLLGVAGLWIDGVRFLEPGGRGAARLIPLTFGFWRHLRPGDVVTMHETRDPVGAARVTEIRLPVNPG
ncbi:hypothetical protein [Streptosporangium jomthongense]|uniref:Uncharacterized protein n=1 Tax=Streptosporangium jomthongense TaxID=1193683 RepID=A0ABV8EXY6_9ACTN